jgi:ribosome maturation factor RimP
MIENNIKELLLMRLKDLGFHLIRVKIISLNGKKTLQIMAERIKDRGMDIGDCTFVSRQVSAFLDVEDPISSAYTLEVSSGGLSRPLTILDDYECFKGSKVKVTLKESYLGNRSHKGFLHGIDKEGLIVLETEDHEMKINFAEIEKSNIDLNWAIKNQNIKLK